MNTFKWYAVAVSLVVLLAGTTSEAAAGLSWVGKRLLDTLDNLSDPLRDLSEYVGKDLMERIPKEIEKCIKAVHGDADRRHLCRDLLHEWLGTAEKSDRYKAKNRFGNLKPPSPPRQRRLLKEDWWRHFPDNAPWNWDNEQGPSDRAARQPSFRL